MRIVAEPVAVQPPAPHNPDVAPAAEGELVRTRRRRRTKAEMAAEHAEREATLSEILSDN